MRLEAQAGFCRYYDPFYYDPYCGSRSNFDQDDYTLSQPMATIPAGELFTTFTIGTLDDDVYEGDEVCTVCALEYS